MKITRLRPWVLITISCIFLVGILYYSYEVITWNKHVKENDKIQKKIEEKIVVSKEDKSYQIDFKALKEMNPDTIAYLSVNNTNINRIVVKGKDNQYYLSHNFFHNWNQAGWVFADYRNRLDGTDKNIIIYGHNVKDGSMFDTLIRVLDEDWYTKEENHKITFITEQGTYYYQVFSTYSIIPEEYYITTDFKDKSEYSKFIQTLKSRSIYDYQTEVTKDDKILTLSSCIGDGKKRVVLHAKLLEEERIEENDRD